MFQISYLRSFFPDLIENVQNKNQRIEKLTKESENKVKVLENLQQELNAQTNAYGDVHE